ncbi:hypothetical protein [Microbacterium sp. 77mftsu3.1]|uniref:hypothetical protein n=1 Tax=Microbacterium sp. 77mftsu3.1 TaxID=1761802 RepID=UPI00035C8F73|nr:hypothetical protein [Microbacterium sp. 77mftsu3.1]SDH43568.1 hypothetical protein SAMN04488590_3340 [Microbacterium sp. 77mftsu3.1]
MTLEADPTADIKVGSRWRRYGEGGGGDIVITGIASPWEVEWTALESVASIWDEPAHGTMQAFTLRDGFYPIAVGQPAEIRIGPWTAYPEQSDDGPYVQLSYGRSDTAGVRDGVVHFECDVTEIDSLITTLQRVKRLAREVTPRMEETTPTTGGN